MWCTFDKAEVEEGVDLKNDPLWSWVHLKDGRWHTLGGTPLQLKDGKLQVVKSKKFNPPADMAPDFYRKRS